FFTLFECELPFFVCPPFNFVQHQLDYRHIQGADSSLDICGIFSVYLCAVDCMFSAVDSFRVCVCVCVCVCVYVLFGCVYLALCIVCVCVCVCTCVCTCVCVCVCTFLSALCVCVCV